MQVQISVELKTGLSLLFFLLLYSSAANTNITKQLCESAMLDVDVDAETDAQNTFYITLTYYNTCTVSWSVDLCLGGVSRPGVCVYIHNPNIC